MKCNAKWMRLIAASSLFPLFGWSCTSDFRDAAVAGILDFVTGSMTDSLTALLPIADTISGG